MCVFGALRSYDYVTNDGTLFYLKTNCAAPRYRVVAIDTARPAADQWVEVVPQHDVHVRVGWRVRVRVRGCAGGCACGCACGCGCVLSLFALTFTHMCHLAAGVGQSMCRGQESTVVLPRARCAGAPVVVMVLVHVSSVGRSVGRSLVWQQQHHHRRHRHHCH